MLGARHNVKVVGLLDIIHGVGDSVFTTNRLSLGHTVKPAAYLFQPVINLATLYTGLLLYSLKVPPCGPSPDGRPVFFICLSLSRTASGCTACALPSGRPVPLGPGLDLLLSGKCLHTELPRDQS